MKKIALSQSMEALVSDKDYDFLNQWTWYANNTGWGIYAARNGSRKAQSKEDHTIYMHYVVAERMGIVGRADHEDRNGLNNQQENLRAATPTQNNANTGLRSTNSSGYKGVSYDRQKNYWQARIRVEKRQAFLGYFDSPIKAAKAYDAAAKRFYGKFAVLNFPGDS